MRKIVEVLALLLGGWFVTWSAPWLVALIAASPGLRALISGIRATGLPVQYVYPLLTNYLPIFLLALLVGLPLFKWALGKRSWLWVVATVPWASYALEGYIELCLDTEVSCFGASPFHEILGLLSVPLGLAVAAVISRSTKPPSSNKAVETDALARPRATRASRSGRASLRLGRRKSTVVWVNACRVGSTRCCRCGGISRNGLAVPVQDQASLSQALSVLRDLCSAPQRNRCFGCRPLPPKARLLDVAQA